MSSTVPTPKNAKKRKIPQIPSSFAVGAVAAKKRSAGDPTRPTTAAIRPQMNQTLRENVAVPPAVRRFVGYTESGEKIYDAPKATVEQEEEEFDEYASYEPEDDEEEDVVDGTVSPAPSSPIFVNSSREISLEAIWKNIMGQVTIEGRDQAQKQYSQLTSEMFRPLQYDHLVPSIEGKTAEEAVAVLTSTCTALILYMNREFSRLNIMTRESKNGRRSSDTPCAAQAVTFSRAHILDLDASEYSFHLPLENGSQEVNLLPLLKCAEFEGRSGVIYDVLGTINRETFSKIAAGTECLYSGHLTSRDGKYILVPPEYPVMLRDLFWKGCRLAQVLQEDEKEEVRNSLLDVARKQLIDYLERKRRNSKE